MSENQDSPINVCLDFMRAVKAFEDQMTLVGKPPLSLTLIQLLMMKAIGESNEPLNPIELKRKVPFYMSNPTHNQERLIGCGLISKVRCKNDGRVILLSLTDKGQNFIPQIDAYLNKVAEKTIRALPALGLGTKR